MSTTMNHVTTMSTTMNHVTPTQMSAPAAEAEPDEEEDDIRMSMYDESDPFAFVIPSTMDGIDEAPPAGWTPQRRLSVRNMKIQRAQAGVQVKKTHNKQPALAKLRENQELQKRSQEVSPTEGSCPKKDVRSKWRFTAKKVRTMSDEWAAHRWDDWTVEKAVRYRYNYFKQNWSVDVVSVRMENVPFGHGAMRECFRIKKLSNFVKDDWRSPSTNFVAKRYLEDVERKVYEDDVILQSVAKVWGEIYNLKANVRRKVDICQMCLLEFTERPESPVYHLESFIPGEYIKYNSNSGFVDYDENKCRNTPHAFSHFTFEFSGHALIVVDIQGVGDIYTDPQIHTHDGLGFGDGNLGPRGMALFFHSHECNPICKALGLSPFDLSMREKGESLRQRTYSAGVEGSHTMGRQVDASLSPVPCHTRFSSQSASRTHPTTHPSTLPIVTSPPPVVEETTKTNGECVASTSSTNGKKVVESPEDAVGGSQVRTLHRSNTEQHSRNHSGEEGHEHVIGSPVSMTALLSGVNADSAARLQHAYVALLNRQLSTGSSHSGQISAAPSSASPFINEDDFQDADSSQESSGVSMKEKKQDVAITSRQTSGEAVCCSPPGSITIVSHPFQGTGTASTHSTSMSPTSPHSMDSGVFEVPEVSGERRRRVRMESSCSEGMDEVSREQMLHQMCEHNRRFSCVKMAGGSATLAKIHHELARLHETGRFLVNKEVDKVDWSSVVFHEEKAAELGYVGALVNLGRYHVGLSTDIFPTDEELDLAREDRKGFLYLLQAANAGHLASMALIADMFRTGHSMTRASESSTAQPDWEAAVHWYQKLISGLQARLEGGDEGADSEALAAEENMLPDKEIYELQGALAEMLATGGHGLEKDATKAYELYYEAGDSATAAMKGRLAAKYYEAAECIEE